MRGNEIPNEQKDRHDNMLSDGDDIWARYLFWTDWYGDADKMRAEWTCLQYLDFFLNSSIQVNVVGSNTRSDAELEVLCFWDEICGKVSRVEWSGDQDFCLSDG